MNHTTAFQTFKYNGCHNSAKKSGRRRSSSSCGEISHGSSADLAGPSRLDRLAGGEADQDRLPASHNHLKRYGSIGQLSSVPKTGPYLCTG